MNILLVDDEKLALQDLENAALKALPKETLHSFSSAEEAMRFANTTPIDIAFLDISMNGMDGMEMAENLNRLWPKINVIFCTGYEEYLKGAFKLHASGYLMKPISSDDIKEELAHLRNEVDDNKSRIRLQCFGTFEAFCDEVPIRFRHRKTKELLAFLVDRNGATSTPRQIMAALFESDNQNYYSLLRQELIKTFEDLGIGDALQTAYGMLAIDKSKVKCDYYDYLDGKIGNRPKEYMEQYSFGENTAGLLQNI